MCKIQKFRYYEYTLFLFHKKPRDPFSPQSLLKKSLKKPWKFLMGFLIFSNCEIFINIFESFSSFWGYLIVENFLGHRHPISNFWHPRPGFL